MHVCGKLHYLIFRLNGPLIIWGGGGGNVCKRHLFVVLLRKLCFRIGKHHLKTYKHQSSTSEILMECKTNSNRSSQQSILMEDCISRLHIRTKEGSQPLKKSMLPTHVCVRVTHELHLFTSNTSTVYCSHSQPSTGQMWSSLNSLVDQQQLKTQEPCTGTIASYSQGQTDTSSALPGLT